MKRKMKRCEKLIKVKSDTERHLSPSYTVADWKRLTLDAQEDWNKAITIFEDRVKGFLFGPVNKAWRHRNSTLAVMLTDCAVIEMLEQFRETPVNKNYFKGVSKKRYISFLRREPFKWKANLAEEFYKKIRCSLAHRFEIAYGSEVKNSGTSLIACFTKNKGGIIVNKTKFHETLNSALELYLAELRSEENSLLRKNFQENMDKLCGQPVDDRRGLDKGVR